MNFYLYLICVFTICLSFVSAEEGAPLLVKSTKLYDTSWDNPSDGTSPTLKFWKLKITLYDDCVFETNHKNFPEHTDPMTLFNPDDTLQILQEAYIDNNPACSWFRVLNVTKGQEFELTGLARKPKPMIESDTPFVKSLLKKQISDNKWSLTFCIKNLKSLLKTEMTEFYTTIEVDSEKYHGYYEEMPLTFIEEQAEEMDEFGKIRTSLVFLDPKLNAEITFKSKWLGGTNIFVVENVDVNIYSWGTRVGAMAWIIHIQLNDGEIFKLHGKHDPFSSKKGIPCSVVENLFRVGDKVELMEEPTSDPAQSEYQTTYKVKNLRTGDVHLFSGDIRFLNGYLPIL
jgi:hypothetical protein